MADNGTTFALDARYWPGAEQARQDRAMGISIAMTTLGMVFVGLRVYTRAFIVRRMGSEDWTMIAAATLTMVYLIQLIVGSVKFKVGFSAMSVTLEQMVGGAKLGLSMVIIYKTVVTLIKISILLIYLRLSLTKTFAWICKGSIALLATYQFITIIVVGLECQPIRKVWDWSAPGHCINVSLFYYITSGFHIFMDLVILVLPYRIVIAIPRPLKERLGVYAIFGLGAISTLCACVRFNYLVVIYNSKDPLYDSLSVNTWSAVEINVGIVCACMQTLRPLFSKSQRNRTRSALRLSDDENTRARTKRGGLLQAKEMFITITAGSFSSQAKTRDSTASSLSEEFNRLADNPPPVPPKDLKKPPKSYWRR